MLDLTKRSKQLRTLMGVVASLKNSQGFYSRLWANLSSMSEEELDELDEFVSKQTFNDEVDVILFLEGGN